MNNWYYWNSDPVPYNKYLCVFVFVTCSWPLPDHSPEQYMLDSPYLVLKLCTVFEFWHWFNKEPCNRIPYDSKIYYKDKQKKT